MSSPRSGRVGSSRVGSVEIQTATRQRELTSDTRRARPTHKEEECARECDYRTTYLASVPALGVSVVVGLRPSLFLVGGGGGGWAGQPRGASWREPSRSVQSGNWGRRVGRCTQHAIGPTPQMKEICMYRERWLSTLRGCKAHPPSQTLSKRRIHALQQIAGIGEIKQDKMVRIIHQSYIIDTISLYSRFLSVYPDRIFSCRPFLPPTVRSVGGTAGSAGSLVSSRLLLIVSAGDDLAARHERTAAPHARHHRDNQRANEQHDTRHTKRVRSGDQIVHRK